MFKNLNELKNSGRFTISKNGPTQGTVNGKKISKEVASLIENSNAVFVKGARSYEMLQGIKKTAYFAFTVCREFSEAVTGLDARNLPLVLIRQRSGECSFCNFKYRAKRKHTFPGGRTIYTAERTAMEYINKRHYYYRMVI